MTLLFLFISRILISKKQTIICCTLHLQLQSALVPLPQLRTMFSSKVICFIFLVVFFNIWGQARGYERKRSLADAVKKFYLVKTKGAKSTDKHLETSAEDNWKNSPAEEVPNYQTDEDYKSQDHEYEEPKPKRRGKGSQNKSTMHYCPDGTIYFTNEWHEDDDVFC